MKHGENEIMWELKMYKVNKQHTRKPSQSIPVNVVGGTPVKTSKSGSTDYVNKL